MVVLDKTLKAPESPDPTWGIEKRKHTVKDFATFLKVLPITLICLAISFYPPLSGIELGEGQALRELGYFLSVFSGIVSLILLHVSMVKPAEEATSLCDAKAHQWVQNVLKPYIEKKYGIKFYRDEPLFGWNFPRGQYEGKTIEIRINGVEADRNYRFASDIGHRIYSVSRDGIWIEEVVRPASVSFKAMQPVQTLA